MQDAASKHNPLYNRTQLGNFPTVRTTSTTAGEDIAASRSAALANQWAKAVPLGDAPAGGKAPGLATRQAAVDRGISPEESAHRWRQVAGGIPEAKVQEFVSKGHHVPDDVWEAHQARSSTAGATRRDRIAANNAVMRPALDRRSHKISVLRRDRAVEASKGASSQSIQDRMEFADSPLRKIVGAPRELLDADTRVKYMHMSDGPSPEEVTEDRNASVTAGESLGNTTLGTQIDDAEQQGIAKAKAFLVEGGGGRRKQKPNLGRPGS